MRLIDRAGHVPDHHRDREPTAAWSEHRQSAGVNVVTPGEGETHDPQSHSRRAARARTSRGTPAGGRPATTDCPRLSGPAHPDAPSSPTDRAHAGATWRTTAVLRPTRDARGRIG